MRGPRIVGASAPEEGPKIYFDPHIAEIMKAARQVEAESDELGRQKLGAGTRRERRAMQRFVETRTRKARRRAG